MSFPTSPLMLLRGRRGSKRVERRGRTDATLRRSRTELPSPAAAVDQARMLTMTSLQVSSSDLDPDSPVEDRSACSLVGRLAVSPTRPSGSSLSSAQPGSKCLDVSRHTSCGRVHSHFPAIRMLVIRGDKARQQPARLQNAPRRTPSAEQRAKIADLSICSIGYVIMGAVCFGVMTSLGEMATYLREFLFRAELTGPSPASIADYACIASQLTRRDSLDMPLVSLTLQWGESALVLSSAKPCRAKSLTCRRPPF